MTHPIHYAELCACGIIVNQCRCPALDKVKITSTVPCRHKGAALAPDTDIVKQLREEIAHLSKDNRNLSREGMDLTRALREANAQLEGNPDPVIASLKSQIEDLEEQVEDLKADAREADEIEAELELQYVGRDERVKRYLKLAAEGRAPRWCDVCDTMRGHTPDCFIRAVAG